MGGNTHVTAGSPSLGELKGRGAAEGLRMAAQFHFGRAMTFSREARRGDATDPRLTSAKEHAALGLEILTELITANGATEKKS